MSRSTVSLTLTLPPVAHGAIAALAHLAGDNRAGGAVLALAFAEMERRQPGLWARIALQAFGARAEGEAAADLAARAAQFFLEALTTPAPHCAAPHDPPYEPPPTREQLLAQAEEHEIRAHACRVQAGEHARPKPHTRLCRRGCCYECTDCAAKPGSPTLCDDCIARRDACNQKRGDR